MPFADLGPVRLHYQVTGHGPPLVLIPGWTLNLRLWDQMLPALEPFHRVLRYDVRGAGRSTSDSSLEFSRMADAEDLWALLDHLNLQDVHLAGHSKGALIAFVAAMSRPGAVLSLSSIGSPGPFSRPGGEAAFQSIARAWVERIRHTARTLGAHAAVEKLESASLFGKVRTSVDGMRRLHGAMEGYVGADLLSDTLKRTMEVPTPESQMTIPVQFVVGEEDPFRPECESAHARLPGSAMAILKHCGHMAPLERPGALAKAILNHSRRPASTAPDGGGEASRDSISRVDII